MEYEIEKDRNEITFLMIDKDGEINSETVCFSEGYAFLKKATKAITDHWGKPLERNGHIKHIERVRLARETIAQNKAAIRRWRKSRGTTPRLRQVRPRDDTIQEDRVDAGIKSSHTRAF